MLTNNPPVDGGSDLRGSDLRGADLRPDLADPASDAIGDPCTFDCTIPGGICLTAEQGFEGGYCTQDCNDFGTCAKGATCVPTGQGNSGLCFDQCANDSECRKGYTCDPNYAVCLPSETTNPDELQPGTKNGAACTTPIEMPVPDQVYTNELLSRSDSFALHPTVAVDVANKRVAVAYYEYQPNGNDGIKVRVSNNGGFDFDQPLALLRGAAGMLADYVYYPRLVVDASGNFYISFLGYELDNMQQSYTAMNVFVAASTDGGKTFTNVVVTPPGEFETDGSLDTSNLAVAPNGTLLATWSQYNPTDGLVHIRASRSTDQGQTWSTPLTISNSTGRPLVTRSLASAEFDAANNAYVVWFEYGADYYGSPDNAVYVQKLDSAGALSGGNQKVSGGADSPAYDYPSIAVQGTSLYVGFASGTIAGAWDLRVAIANGGTTFGPSFRVNTDATCATHFHHRLIADPNGTVNAVYYDNRYLLGNVLYQSIGIAPDGSPAIGEEVFVNDESFGFTTSLQDANTLSDYMGLTFAGGELYTTWTDGRSGQSNAYYAKIFH